MVCSYTYISSYTNQHFTDYEKNKWNFLLTSSSFFFEKSSFCFALFGIVWLQTQISSFFSILLSFLFFIFLSFIFTFLVSMFDLYFLFLYCVAVVCFLFREKKKKKKRRKREEETQKTTAAQPHHSLHPPGITGVQQEERRRTKRRRRRKERVLHLNCEIICTVRFTVHMLWTTKCIHSPFRIHSHTNSYLILFIVQIDTHTKTYQKQIIY